jgi:hypothetical protein
MGIDLQVMASFYREHAGEMLPTATVRFERDPTLFSRLAPDSVPCLVRPLPEGLRVGCYEDDGLRFVDADRYGAVRDRRAADPAMAAACAARVAASSVYGEEAGQAAEAARSAEGGETATAWQWGLLRDLFDPFGRLAAEPAWLAWSGGTVPRLAEEAYRQRLLPAGLLDPESLSVLADALEDAGCGDEGLLGHLRGPGPHLAGCRAIDALAGRG